MRQRLASFNPRASGRRVGGHLAHRPLVGPRTHPSIPNLLFKKVLFGCGRSAWRRPARIDVHSGQSAPSTSSARHDYSTTGLTGSTGHSFPRLSLEVTFCVLECVSGTPHAHPWHVKRRSQETRSQEHLIRGRWVRRGGYCYCPNGSICPRISPAAPEGLLKKRQRAQMSWLKLSSPTGYREPGPWLISLPETAAYEG